MKTLRPGVSLTSRGRAWLNGLLDAVPRRHLPCDHLQYTNALLTAAEVCKCCRHAADDLSAATLARCASCHITVCAGEPQFESCCYFRAYYNTLQHLRLDWRSRRILPHNEAVHVVTRVCAVLCPAGSWAGA
jgi:hypothetical protein